MDSLVVSQMKDSFRCSVLHITQWYLASPTLLGNLVASVTSTTHRGSGEENKYLASYSSIWRPTNSLDLPQQLA